jgi:hypothetical protein
MPRTRLCYVVIHLRSCLRQSTHLDHQADSGQSSIIVVWYSSEVVIILTKKGWQCHADVIHAATKSLNVTVGIFRTVMGTIFTHMHSTSNFRCKYTTSPPKFGAGSNLGVRFMKCLTDPTGGNDNVGNYNTVLMNDGRITESLCCNWLLTSLIITRTMGVNYTASVVAEPCSCREVLHHSNAEST